jgi:hypothetical protein
MMQFYDTQAYVIIEYIKSVPAVSLKRESDTTMYEGLPFNTCCVSA